MSSRSFCVHQRRWWWWWPCFRWYNEPLSKHTWIWFLCVKIFEMKSGSNAPDTLTWSNYVLSWSTRLLSFNPHARLHAKTKIIQKVKNRSCATFNACLGYLSSICYQIVYSLEQCIVSSIFFQFQDLKWHHPQHVNHHILVYFSFFYCITVVFYDILLSPFKHKSINGQLGALNNFYNLS